MTGWIGISLGDATGISPEITLKALAAEAATDDTKYLLIGDKNYLSRCNQKLGLNLPLKNFFSYEAAGKFFVTDPASEPHMPGPEKTMTERVPPSGSMKLPFPSTAMPLM